MYLIQKLPAAVLGGDSKREKPNYVFSLGNSPMLEVAGERCYLEMPTLRGGGGSSPIPLETPLVLKRNPISESGYHRITREQAVTALVSSNFPDTDSHIANKKRKPGKSTRQGPEKGRCAQAPEDWLSFAYLSFLPPLHTLFMEQLNSSQSQWLPTSQGPGSHPGDISYIFLSAFHRRL